MQSARDRTTRLYELLANEEDARVCKDISEAACRYVPANFFRIIAANTLTKLGDACTNPKTVLAWVLVYAQAPAFMVALLVPIRESGSMLPQLFIASHIRERPLRKNTWVLGSILQAAAVFVMALGAAYLEGATAGWLIVAGLIVFSLARGLCSVASKDVLGKTIPKTRRGRLNGLSASVSGVLVICLGLFLLVDPETATPALFSWIFVFAGFLWLLAAVVFAGIEEHPGETAGAGNAFTEAIKRLGILKSDPPFRRFVITRALFLCSALSAPYYVVLAQHGSGGALLHLGLFVLASGLAESLSATVWGIAADASSRRVMIGAATMAAILGVAAFVIENFIPAARAALWTYPSLFFLLGIAHSGVRLGRKTYVLDLAGGNKRTDYVAVGNTVIGLVLLLAGALGALSSVLSADEIVLLLSLAGFAGALLGTRLPEAH